MKDCAHAEILNHNIYTNKRSRRLMPVVSVSLSERGFEGYTSLTKGLRSRIIDKLLCEYALKRTYTVINEEHLSVHDVMKRQFHFKETMQQSQDEINKLRQERDELEDKLDSWSKEFQEGAKE
jgi:hypothetical protein